MKKYFYFILLTISLSACFRTHFYNGKVDLLFSVDTLFFDTVFTYVGSTTHRLLVYNPYDKPVKLKRIYLAGGKASPFRINIDGYPSLDVSNITIDARDSMYIFVEVTINPEKDNLIEKDSLIFVSENNTQKVILLAVGQDVHLINGERIKTQTWTNDKPYLIYNSVLVDSNEVLTIASGTKIYSHRGSYIYAYGSIHVNGTREEPVLFAGDRLEQDYNNLPGQWGGIRLLPGSHDNIINYAIIKDAIVGIEIDTLTDTTNFNLIVANSKIEHHSFAGIYALATKTLVYNTVIADCGYYAAALIMGGEHYFLHCTIDNRYNWIIRKTPSVVFTNYLKVNGNNIFWGKLQVLFANTIIWGNQQNEFIADGVNLPQGMTFTFLNCLMKVDPQINDTTAEVFQNCIFNQNPHFLYEDDSLEYYQERDYRLKSTSAAINSGNLQIVQLNSSILKYDMDGNDRTADGKPDIGAYEYIQ